MHKVYIKPLMMEDVEKAAALEEICFSSPWSKQSFADTVTKDCYQYYAVYVDSEYVGTAGLILGYDEADVSNVAVHPNWRGKGIASILMGHMIQKAQEQGLHSLLLEVREGNTSARRLYEKTGFVIDGVRKNYYQNPVEDAVLMSRKLSL